MKRSLVPLVTTVVILFFFYLPLVLVAVESFNASKYGGPWTGFSLRWYRTLFTDAEVMRALKNTLIVGVVSTVVSMVLGTVAAFALHRYKGKLQTVHYGLIYLPLVVPDILMGISLLLFFVALKVELSLVTITVAHISFCISYVTMVVLGRLQDFDFSVMDAAQDLGADRFTAFRKILLPLLAPGILAGGLLAFTLSIDDFVITFFVSGPGSTTLPVYIYSMMKHGSPPVINALSVVLLAVTFMLVLYSQFLSRGGKEHA